MVYMKKFLVCMGYALGAVVAVLYLAFLFVLPKKVNVTQYVPMLQQLAKEQLNLNVDIKNPRVFTTPILEAGLKTDNVKVTLADGSPVLDTDGLKVKVSLPWALLMTVRVSCVDIINPKINLDTNAQCTQYKLVSEIQDMLNRKNNEVKEDKEEGWFNPEWIRIIVPHIKIENYNIAVNDIKHKHSITLKGDEMKGGFYNFKTAKLKTYAYLMSDNKTNITANLKLDSVIRRPKHDELDADDDKAEKIEIPFYNVVKVYQHYDLKAHVNSKLKIRKNREGKFKLKGFYNVDNLTLRLAKYQLPKCYFHSKFRGNTVKVDTDFYVTPNEHSKVLGKINIAEPSLDLMLKSDKIHFNNLIVFTKAILDSFGISNDLGNLKGNGYIQSNAKIKTNFKHLKSEGKIIIRNGAAINRKIGLVVTGTNSDLLFDNNIFRINNTKIYVSGKPLVIAGSVDEKAIADLYIKTNNLPIAGLYRALAPSSLKKNIKMNSANVSIDARISGKLKKSISSLKFELAKLSVTNKDRSLVINNKDLNLIMMYDKAENILKGNLVNLGLAVRIPSTNSTVTDNEITVDFDNDKIALNRTDLRINKTSSIKLFGRVSDYMNVPLIDFTGDGNLYAKDLKHFAGSAAAPYIDAKGILPIKFKVTGNDKKQFAVMQVLSRSNGYVTPVHFKSLRGKQCITQAKILYKGDRLNIKDTGIFTTRNPFTNDFNANMAGANPVIKFHGTLARLDTMSPRINLLRLDIKPLDGSIYAFRNSKFKLKGGINVFGLLSDPVIFGGIDVDKIRIPSLLTKLEDTGVTFRGKSMHLYANNIDLNGSDLNVSANSNFEFSPVMKLYRLNVQSDNINLDKVMKVSDAAAKTLPKTSGAKTSSKKSSDIPVRAVGRFNFDNIKTGKIILTNTHGRLLLSHNMLRLQPLSTNVFKGNVTGKIGVNLNNNAISMNLNGKNIDTAKALLDAANTKNAISGITAFNMNARLKGNTYQEQMKSLKGGVHFSIKNGGYGPVGELENMILADNIRNSQFFQTALGGIIKNIATIDTAHFTELKGDIKFVNGKAVICPITSQGNVMCLHIAGNYDLLKNEADMQVRGKLGSFVSNMLGPIALLNPINLIKATPGINIVMAKAFSIFTVPVTQAEMNEIPKFAKSEDDFTATKFQIILQGDAAKPLKMIKSFKWLALQNDIDKAKNFTDNMPEEYLLADPTTPEAQAAAAAKAKEDAKLINRVKRKFSKEK